jgi:RNA polymerase sigma factor (sigma-70 family)
MNQRRMSDVIQHLRQIVRPQEAAGLSDAELLRRWVADRDEAAFELMLWRHGPMVLGVCRRILRDGHLAEDAMQATFLALVRKAASIGRSEAVAGWLYRVAYRVALEAKARAARWPPGDADGLDALTILPSETAVWRDLRPVLDEELGRLSAKYRVPFVLHYLEGRTNEEVARELGCPVGTVLSRLGRARERLRFRLIRRGLALSAGALAASLTGNALSAAVPTGVIGPLVKAAAAVAAGQLPASGLVSANAAALADALIRGMTMTKLKMVLTVLLALALVGTGTGALFHRLSARPPTGGPPASANAGQTRAFDRAASTPEKPDEPPAAGAADDRRDKGRQDQPKKEEVQRADEERVRHQQALEQANATLEEAEERYRNVELELSPVRMEYRKRVVREEEQIRLLEREQADQRERERAEYKRLEAKLPASPEDADRKGLKDLEETIRKREAERADRLADARVRLVDQEEGLRRIEREKEFRRELAQIKVQSALDKIRRLEDDLPAADGQARALADVERKLAELLREVGELRCAVERQQPAKGRAP